MNISNWSEIWLPERINQWTIYHDEGIFLGAASVTMPDIQLMTADVEGSLVGGPFTTETWAHTNQMTTTITFRTPINSALLALRPGDHMFEARALIQNNIQAEALWLGNADSVAQAAESEGTATTPHSHQTAFKLTYSKASDIIMPMTIKLFMRGRVTEHNLGNLQVGAQSDSSLTLALNALYVYYNNEAVVKISKYPIEFKIGDVDYGAIIRAAVY